MRIPMRLKLAIPFVVVCSLAVLSAPAFAGTGWYVTSTAYPTDVPPGEEGGIEIAVKNVGDTPSAGPVTVTDTLPRGVTVTQAGDLQYGEGGAIGREGLWDCSIAPGVEDNSVVTCVSNPVNLPSIPLGNDDLLEYIGLQLDVAPGVSGTLENEVTVAGGGASGPASFSEPIVFSSQPAGYGFQGADVWFSNADGTVDTQAGSHPYEAGFDFHFNTVRDEHGLEPAGGSLRNFEARLPPGLVGNVTAVAQCTREQFEFAECPLGSRIGTDGVLLRGVSCCGHTAAFPVITFFTPVYNMVTPPGVAAQFAFNILGRVVFLDATVRSGGDYGITVHVDNAEEEFTVDGNQLILWGEPADPSHDFERCNEGGPCASGERVRPFLTLGTSCEGPQAQAYNADMDTWENQSTVAISPYFEDDPASTTPLGLTGCADLAFGPSFANSPDTTEAETPAGFVTDVKVNQEGLLSTGATMASDVREVTVTLPEGLVINPDRATGLVACTPAQSGLGAGEAQGDEAPPSCPLASQVGTVQVTTPLLPDKLEGDVYLLESEPPHVKIEIAASADGVNVKLPGYITLNETTGQLVARFPETPQVPFTDFKLAFSGGGQAALATPAACGAYTTNVDFDPWATPFVEDTLESSGFGIDSGPYGSPCVSPLPFTPTMTAGATTDQAGGYTDFTMLLSRADGQQRISKLQFKTPTGLLGMISHVSLCEEPQASKGDCPAGSQIGHTIVGAGPGPDPLYVPEAGQPPAPIYITGPYEGAPYGLSIAVPVIAGPFNLGTTVVRGKIEVDPQTAALTITTDPLPTILDGVPIDMRTIDAVIDRPEFMFNPTNCNPQAFSGTATSTEGTNAALSSPFQVGSCRSLGFKPTFKVSTSAKTSRTEGASLHVSLTLPDEGGLSSIANVQRVKVSLPKQLPSPLTTLQKACLEKVFAANPASCPVASQVGQVKVATPVLPGGLTGTAYFVSHGGAKYPELILVLTGQNGVTEQVHGETFISKAGITTATFATVPDVPFSNFELELPQRQYPALTANGNLCKGTLLMPTEMVGQNGLVIDQSTKIAVTGCPKSKSVKHRKKGARGHAKRKRAGKKKG
jgi:uncharacterized repeat protein (TIGR01451 family)